MAEEKPKEEEKPPKEGEEVSGTYLLKWRPWILVIIVWKIISNDTQGSNFLSSESW